MSNLGRSKGKNNKENVYGKTLGCDNDKNGFNTD